ncbi:MAG: MarR family transcriptional regulator [Clostridiales bacterium]|nr:MarR family transcriptional regulator [Clostridiales bacterium]
MKYDDLDCAGLTKHIHDKMEKGANEKLARLGLTFAQMQMMMALYRMKNDSVPLKSLERHFEVAQSTAAGLIVRLERKGLVEGFTPSEDRRLKYVRLTEKGKEICATSEEDAKEGDRILLSGLDEEERIQFYHLLTKIKNNLK